MTPRHWLRWWMVLLVIDPSCVGDAVAAPSPAPGDQALQQSFAVAAREWAVPAPMLLAVSYNVFRWEDHGGDRREHPGVLLQWVGSHHVTSWPLNASL